MARLAILMKRHQLFDFVGRSFTAGSVVLPPLCGDGLSLLPASISI